MGASSDNTTQSNYTWSCVSLIFLIYRLFSLGITMVTPFILGVSSPPAACHLQITFLNPIIFRNVSVNRLWIVTRPANNLAAPGPTPATVSSASDQGTHGTGGISSFKALIFKWLSFDLSPLGESRFLSPSTSGPSPSQTRQMEMTMPLTTYNIYLVLRISLVPWWEV